MPTLRGLNFGHRAPALAIASLIVSCAFDIYAYAAGTLSLWAIIIAGPIVGATLIGSLIALFFHGRRLCEECVRSMPLDCAAKAKRNYYHFWFVHLLDRNKKAYWAAVLALIVATFIFTGLPGLLVTLVFKLAGVEIIYASVAHRKLQPWCPWCGERGIEILRPDPVLSPLGVG